MKAGWGFLYDVLVRLLTFGREQRMREAMLDIARITSGERVLDVGCGTGTLALAVRLRVGREGTVHGTDLAEQMVARARQKATHNAIDVCFDVAPAHALPFASGAFDLVLCTLALHHLVEEVRHPAIAEMGRVLRPGGRLLIVDLAREDGPWAALNPIHLLHGHGASRASKDAEALMRAAGFRGVAKGMLGFQGLDWVLGSAGQASSEVADSAR